MEDGLKLIISQLKVFFGAMEVFFEHGYVIILQGVVEGKVAIVVEDVGSWADLINDWQLHFHAYDMLNSLSLIVLHATSLEEFIVSSEPVEYVLISIPCAFEKRVLTKVVTLFKRFILVLGENLEHLQILLLCCDVDTVMSFVVRSETLVVVKLVEFGSYFMLARAYSDMQWKITLNCVLAVQKIQGGERLSIKQEV